MCKRVPKTPIKTWVCAYLLDEGSWAEADLIVVGLEKLSIRQKGALIKKLSERLAGINQYTAAKSLVQSICFRVLVLVFCCAVFGCGRSRKAIKRRRQQQAVDFNARLNDWVCVFTHLTYDRSSCGFALATKTLIVITSRHAMSLVSTFVENQWITLNDGKRCMEH